MIELVSELYVGTMVTIGVGAPAIGIGVLIYDKYQSRKQRTSEARLRSSESDLTNLIYNNSGENN